MHSAVAKYMTMAVPRYTSYPTVPHFHGGVDETIYRGWLAHLDPAEPISLYLHVPFCRQICWYCACNMKLAGHRDQRLKDYADLLAAEVDLLAAALPARTTVSHLHWGGGTPTALTGDDLAMIMSRIRDRFEVADDAEIAIECDPRTFEPQTAMWLGALGFNRASFGVQEFDPKVQATINRIQPPDMVAAAVDALRREGIEDINFDLIYGLPHQTTQMLLDTVKHCLALHPSRIALFGYAHVPWMAKKQRLIPTEALPGADERLEQGTRAAEAIVAGGMVAIGLDHFARRDDPLAIAAREGTLRRNFQGYTTDNATALLGLGATSIGRMRSGYVQNIAEPGAWGRAVRAGHLPVAKGVALSDDDALRQHVIEQLMCGGTVDTDDVGRTFDAPEGWADEALAALAPMAEDGLVVLHNGRVEVTELGRPLVRVVASTFDVYFRKTAQQHSSAV